MAFLSAVIGIVDSSGVRVDRARSDGTYAPIMLVLDDSLTGTSAENGGLTQVTLQVSAAQSINSLVLADYLQVGTKRFMATTPDLAGRFTLDSNGRLQVYVDGAARVVPTVADNPIIITLRKAGVDANPSDSVEQALQPASYPFALTIDSGFLVLDDDGEAPYTGVLDNTDFVRIEVSTDNGGGTLHCAASTQASGIESIGSLNPATKFPLTISNASVPANALWTSTNVKHGAGVITGGYTIQLTCYATLP